MPRQPMVLIDRARPQHEKSAVLLKRARVRVDRLPAAIILRPNQGKGARAAALRAMELQLPGAREYCNLDEYRAKYGSSPKDLQAVAKYVSQKGLSVEESSAEGHYLLVSGPLRGYSAAFGASFEHYDHPEGSYTSHKGGLRVPESLRGVIDTVVGLDTRTLADHHFFSAPVHELRPMDPTRVLRAYRFPAQTGKGQTIGIIELGGGFHRSDVQQFFARHGLAPRRVNVVEIGGAKNNPAPKSMIRRFWRKSLELLESGQPPSGPLTGDAEMDLLVKWTIESTMDIQLAGLLAPEADLVAYFTPNTAQGKHLGLSKAVMDRKHNPSVLSCSWGSDEMRMTGPVTVAMQRVLESAALMGITVCCSTGDDGDGTFLPNGQPNGEKPSVHSPSTFPYALACGGTILHMKGTRARKEVVWDESIGGFRMASTGGASRRFSTPKWQQPLDIAKLCGHEGRAVPDISAKADLGQGYAVEVGGITISMGGTSAAAPLWAALIARMNQALGRRVGLLTALLYTSQFLGVMNDVTSGENGPNFRARKGWDPCCGWGSPDGRALLRALRGK